MNEESYSSEQHSTASLEQRLETHKKEVLANRNPSYQLPHKKQVGKGKGTFVERDLFESDAFWSLTGGAPQMLIYLLAKRNLKKTKNGSWHCLNGHELNLTYIELKKLGVTQPRGTRSFDELLAKGFIELVHQGGAYKKDQSIYSLSNKWLLWKKGIIFSTRPIIFKRGFQGGRKTKITYGSIGHTRIRRRTKEQILQQ